MINTFISLLEEEEDTLDRIKPFFDQYKFMSPYVYRQRIDNYYEIYGESDLPIVVRRKFIEYKYDRKRSRN